MEANKQNKITEYKINKACQDGFIDYLHANMLSMWIDGKEVQIMDISKQPKSSEIYPNLKPIYEIGEVIEELVDNKKVTLNFNSGCCVLKTTGLPLGDCEKVEVVSSHSNGILTKLEDNSLKFEIERIYFNTKYKQY